MLILDAVGLQIRRSGGAGAPNDPNTCTCFSYIFNLSLDLWSLAKQECFSCKDTTNGTVQSDFPFFSFDSFFSFFSPLIVHRLFPTDYQWGTS